MKSLKDSIFLIYNSNIELQKYFKGEEPESQEFYLLIDYWLKHNLSLKRPRKKGK